MTDSIACLPPELVKEYDVRVLPFTLIVDGRPYRDDQKDITTGEFWGRFREIKQFSTSTINVGQYAEAFADASRSADSIVCICVSKALTGAYESAIQARDMMKEEGRKLSIEVIDSKTAGGAEGFVVLEAVRAAKAGKSMSEVVKAAGELVPRVKFLCAMDTLEYLIKSGRAPQAAAMMKPIVGLTDGSGVVQNLGQALSTKESRQRMVEMVKTYCDTSRPMHFMVHYTDSIAAGEELKALVSATYENIAEVYLTPYTPVMSGHTGPVVALSFYS